MSRGRSSAKVYNSQFNYCKSFTDNPRNLAWHGPFTRRNSSLCPKQAMKQIVQIIPLITHSFLYQILGYYPSYTISYRKNEVDNC